MPRKTCLAVLVLLVGSVLDARWAAALAPVPKPPPRPVISLGQPLEEALDALTKAKARDFSANVGFFRPVPKGTPPQETFWFTLRDGTCVCILARAKEMQRQGPLFILELELGEEGKGYGNQDHWFKQKRRHVNSLELP